jgi:uncharacterized protein (TIGR00255 family)
MTGFGRAVLNESNVEICAEVRGVNHRFLDISARLPRVYSAFEPQLRRITAEALQRGKVDVSVTRSGNAGAIMDVNLDASLAATFHKKLTELISTLGLAGEVTVSDMLTLKEILTPVEKPEAVEAEFPAVERALRKALASFDEMREREGRALWSDIETRVVLIRESAAGVKTLAHETTAAAADRIRRRIGELTDGVNLDEGRLHQEIAYIVDRCDITEELARIDSHLDQFSSSGRNGSPIGRKLDFILQELLREVNTIGSKSGSALISRHVVAMKVELEKIREQIQNIE